MRTSFETERGDEFMSLVYALSEEADTGDPAVADAARTELEEILARGIGQPVHLRQPVPTQVAPAVGAQADPAVGPDADPALGAEIDISVPVDPEPAAEP